MRTDCGTPCALKNQRGAVGHLVHFLDEDRAGGAQLVHHVAVVHHLVAHVDRRAVGFQRTFDDGDGAIHAGAESARIGEQDVHASQVPVRIA